MKRKLTDKQLEVLVFFQDFFSEHDHLPTAQDLVRHYGWSRDNGVEYQKQLCKRGYIEKSVSGKYRFTRQQEASHV